jgi:hypothetical protein
MAVTIFGSNLGSSEERQRLRRVYEALSDGELERLAHEAGSLTPEAKAALTVELSRREIAGEIEAGEGGEPKPRTEVRDLLTIRQFRDLPEALLARSVLESAGIECFLGDDNLIRMDWLWSNLLGGIKLRVRQEDALVASRLLEGGEAAASGETEPENLPK